MSRGPLVLGDMGHALFRLSRARATSRSVGFDIKEVLYPGFEGRPDAASLDAFLEAVELQVDVYRLSHANPLIYATGFGSLVLLALRARAEVPDLPAVIQGPIPWLSIQSRGPGEAQAGERERRRYEQPEARERFVLDHFQSPLDESERRAFFAGFSTCTAFPSIYDWFDAGWLAALEGQLAARPPAIDGIRVWAAGSDELVPEEEHDAAVRALGAQWSTERADSWGHFPYLDAPGPWVGALQAVGV